MAKNSPQDVKNREHFSNQLNKIMKSKLSVAYVNMS